MFVGDFNNEHDVCREFHISEVGGVILFAGYEYEDYSGSADVIYFGRDGKLYHVSGSHCSCYGLEDQWSPEEMPVEALMHIVEKGYGPMNKYATEIRERVAVVLDYLGLKDASPENIQFALKMAFG